MAFPQKQRLKLARDFRAVSRSQLASKEGELLLKAKPIRAQSSRFGVVISKSVAKRAVERNRMRRLLVEALRERQNSLRSSFDIILVALPGFSLHDLKEAQRIIGKLFLKAAITQQ